MKKLAIITIISLIATSTWAQSARSGIKGGVNFSNLFISDVTTENVRTGFQAGVFTQLLLPSNKIGVQPELLYTNKGARAEYDVLNIQGEADFNLNYLELPVLLVFKLGDDVDIHIGPYAALLLNSSMTAEGDFGSIQTELDEEHFKTFDIGISGGLAFNFDLVSFGVRYNYGFKPVADSEAAETFLGNAKNGVGQVYVALNLAR